MKLYHTWYLHKALLAKTTSSYQRTEEKKIWLMFQTIVQWNLNFEKENTQNSVREVTNFAKGASLCKICYFLLLHWWGEKINLGVLFFGVQNFRTFTVINSFENNNISCLKHLRTIWNTVMIRSFHGRQSSVNRTVPDLTADRSQQQDRPRSDWLHYVLVKPHCSNFRIITAILGCL